MIFFVAKMESKYIEPAGYKCSKSFEFKLCLRLSVTFLSFQLMFHVHVRPDNLLYKREFEFIRQKIALKY
jgi:hypothetical protein